MSGSTNHTTSPSGGQTAAKIPISLKYNGEITTEAVFGKRYGWLFAVNHYDDLWMITHLPSGNALCYFCTLADAAACAQVIIQYEGYIHQAWLHKESGGKFGKRETKAFKFTEVWELIDRFNGSRNPDKIRHMRDHKYHYKGGSRE